MQKHNPQDKISSSCQTLNLGSTLSANLTWCAFVLNTTRWCMHAHLHTGTVRKWARGSCSVLQTRLSASAIQTDCLPTPNDYWHTEHTLKHTPKTKEHSDTQTTIRHKTRWHWDESIPSPELCNCRSEPAPHTEFSPGVNNLFNASLPTYFRRRREHVCMPVPEMKHWICLF